ncbi:MAG TPA: ATP-binding cassette domain-containing protein, partial [Deinococcales bacterium]|nr:ATP-binding cassette domain-containing protein [Deinococcales bacterium]
MTAVEETLSMRGITKSYPTADGDYPVLKGLSLTIRKGEMAALMGPSGSGKSTLMNILGILDRQTSGEYVLQGVNVADLSEAERAEARNRFIGFVFQAFHLLPRLTLQENVELPMMYGRVPAGHRRRRALELLDRVGLGDRAQNRPGQLS